MTGKRFGGSGTFDFSTNPLNVVLLLLLIIVIIVFFYYVFIWWNKQNKKVAPSAGETKPKTVSFSDVKPKDDKKPEVESKPSSVESFATFSRY